MKLKIFNKGKGWYVSATNYKDNSDKAYMGLYFPYGEPTYMESEKGYSVIDIDILEAKFTSYKGKLGLTVFKFELLSNIDLEDSSKFGGSRDGLADNIIQPDDLPFY